MIYIYIYIYIFVVDFFDYFNFHYIDSYHINIEVDSSDEEEGLSKSSHGRVTHIYQDYGLIDGEVFFTVKEVLSEKTFKLGEEINYVAKRENLSSGWMATSVSMATTWEIDEDGVQDKSMVGIIETFNGELGTINGHIQFSLESEGGTGGTRGEAPEEVSEGGTGLSSTA